MGIIQKTGHGREATPFVYAFHAKAAKALRKGRKAEGPLRTLRFSLRTLREMS